MLFAVVYSVRGTSQKRSRSDLWDSLQTGSRQPATNLRHTTLSPMAAVVSPLWRPARQPFCWKPTHPGGPSSNSGPCP